MDRQTVVIRWLFVIASLILLMVSVGGITRLTQSGLSIVDWNPIMGAIPPLSSDDWHNAFESYKRFPQFQKVNPNMTLEEFKVIFFWEYIHRLLGRLIGIVFLIPWIYLNIRKRIPPGWNGRLAVLFILGGLQGLMGWYMVQSGLIDRPSVSHFRLAAHLALAFTTLGLCVWYILTLRNFDDSQLGAQIHNRRHLRTPAIVFAALVGVQIIYGAFVAGLKAGFGHNTFPSMSGMWIPRGLWVLDPWWVNLFSNNVTLQFIHRNLAWLVLFGAIALYYYAKSKRVDSHTQTICAYLVGIIGLQFVLGVMTLLLVVPIPLAVAHQLGAALTITVTLTLLHALFRVHSNIILPPITRETIHRA